MIYNTSLILGRYYFCYSDIIPFFGLWMSLYLLSTTCYLFWEPVFSIWESLSITALGNGWELSVSRYSPCWLGHSQWLYWFVVVFSALLGWFGFFMFKTVTGIQGRDVCDAVYVVSCMQNLFLFQSCKKSVH